MSAPLRPRPAAPPGVAVPPGGASNGAPLAFPRALTVGVLGAGRVGAVLGAALAAAGHRVVAATGRSGAAQARLALLLPQTPHRSATAVARAATDLLVVAVPDDALAGVVAGLAEAGALRAGQVVAHTSGAHGLAVLAPAVAAGARPLALHPAMTFTGTPDDLTRLAGISYGVTAPAELRPFAARLVADLGGVPEWVAEADRPLYHAALAHGANHLVTLVNEAADRLRDAGVDRPEKVLAPLLRAALENALRLGDDALTGPVSRGDAGTVRRHLERLAATAPESVTPYLALARRTADRAIAAGRLRPADAESLLDVLTGIYREVAA
ncbi:Predicted oxidoreductase, contains short-chain dehydrogenase (SDR) and DUF2520 domains [Micromonospora viridifaciens]|uniref:Predicted oxidoreductase, contains short-chain dehydrogenase (SDR) and DUF2520 domains n=1 Tax=Micromonospora viridifaciens TaxID=1881 RepID=A0A1C4UPP9_MICVI|nr:Predicted oxidoreductase, contains short-chain dehydrogenase (SDR) and DUF2520 domains [Micromonospora viridifaciens]